MKTFHLQTTKELPYHDKIAEQIFLFFYNTPGVTGCFVSGSTATGNMDSDSDLDLGFLIESKTERTSIWEERWQWDIAPWFHRFDADHIKPYFVIYLFEPKIKADINLYIEEDLPGGIGGPYKIIWDKTGVLQKWQDKLQPESKEIFDHSTNVEHHTEKTTIGTQQNVEYWSNTVHEDERFWAWLFYLYGHIHRGEYYHSAQEFPAIRDIFEQWTARLNNQPFFNSRKLELKQYAKELVNGTFFPKPDKESLKKALIKSIEYCLKLREQIKVKLKIKWKTSEKAVKKITALIKTL